MAVLSLTVLLVGIVLTSADQVSLSVRFQSRSVWFARCSHGKLAAAATGLRGAPSFQQRGRADYSFCQVRVDPRTRMLSPGCIRNVK